MNEIAFALTIEAILALLVVAAIASVPIQQQKNSLFELLLLQKENDLLKLWLSEKELSENEMKKDFEFVFPALAGEIRVGKKTVKIFSSTGKRESISSSTMFLTKEGTMEELRITVYN